MPYKYVTYKNGFTEIIGVRVTAAEEADQMRRMAGVKLFPSANHRSTSAMDQEPLEPSQPEQHQKPKQP